MLSGFRLQASISESTSFLGSFLSIFIKTILLLENKEDCRSLSFPYLKSYSLKYSFSI